MKGLMYLIVLGGLGYGVYYLYENHYFDSFLQSVSDTTERTADFATDKAVKEFDANNQAQ